MTFKCIGSDDDPHLLQNLLQSYILSLILLIKIFFLEISV